MTGGENSLNKILNNETYQDIIFNNETTVSNNNSIIADNFIDEQNHFSDIKINESSGYTNIRVSGTIMCNTAGVKFIKIMFGNTASSLISFTATGAGRYNFYCETFEKITANSSKNFKIQMYGNIGEYILNGRATVDFDR